MCVQAFHASRVIVVCPAVHILSGALEIMERILIRAKNDIGFDQSVGGHVNCEVVGCKEEFHYHQLMHYEHLIKYPLRSALIHSPY
jgi:hypothetical protein